MTTKNSFQQEVEDSIDHDFFYLEDVEYKSIEDDPNNTTHVDAINIYTVNRQGDTAKFCTIDNPYDNNNIVWMTYPGLLPIRDDSLLYQKLQKLRTLEHNMFFDKREKLRNNAIDFITKD